MFFAFPRGTVDPVRLWAAANHLAARHPVLHARPEVIRGTPALRREAADVPVERVRPAPDESSADALRRAVSAWSAQGSPMRLYLTDDERADEEILGIVLDHIACDGQSLARVVDELGDAYRDGLGPADLAPADAEAELAAYREAVELQLDAEQRGGSPAALEYWGDRLRAVHERAPLPRPRDPAPGVLPTGAAELRRSAPAGGVPFPALLDACRATARVLYGPGHVPPIGYPWGGRPAAAAQVLGCFLNTVVFPARTHDAPQLPENGGSETTATAWWDDLDRADTPFDEVVHAARSAGARWTGRLDGLLTVDDARRRPPLTLGGVPGREVHIDGRPVRAPFAVSAHPGAGTAHPHGVGPLGARRRSGRGRVRRLLPGAARTGIGGPRPLNHLPGPRRTAGGSAPGTRPQQNTTAQHGRSARSADGRPPRVGGATVPGPHPYHPTRQPQGSPMLPLSSSQEIVWLHEQVQPGSRAYNFTASLDLWGALDTDALRHGLAAALERHPGLRLELVAVPGAMPGQQVADTCAPRLHTVDLTGEADPEAAFLELLRTEAETPLDTYEAPLLRWTLVRLADDQHRLIHVEHHLIHDGHSFAILLADVFTVYRARVLGEPVVLPPASSYADHVRARTDDALTEERQQSLAYWADELRDASHDMPLPGLARPGARRRHHGGQLRQSIGADLAQRLRGHARERGLTPFSTLLGLFAELLRRHSGRSQMVVGTAVGNRPRGYEDAVGMFVNTIPLRLRLDPRAPAEDTMDEVTDTLIRALPHQDVPVQELTRALGMHTSGADNPLFGVMFSAHDAALPEIDVPGLDITLFEGFNTGTTRFDLDVVLLPDDRRGVSLRHGAPGMTLVWDYDADLFGEEVATLLADRFLDLLRAYLDAPATVLADLALPATPAVTQAVAVADGPADDADPLDPAAAHDPSLPALLIGARRLTYGDLDEQVSSLARRMRAAGVTTGQPVAAVLPRGAARSWRCWPVCGPEPCTARSRRPTRRRGSSCCSTGWAPRWSSPPPMRA